MVMPSDLRVSEALVDASTQMSERCAEVVRATRESHGLNAEQTREFAIRGLTFAFCGMATTLGGVEKGDGMALRADLLATLNEHLPEDKQIRE